MWLKQSTAVTVKAGPFVDSTDGVTAETALTISQADIRLSKNGGAFAQSNNATGATHDENGWYDIPLDTTDTNTLGTLRVSVSETGALPVWVDVMVVPANVWDSLFGADKLQVHADEITAGLITATAIASDAITAAKLAADVTTELQSGLATAAALATVDSNVDAILVDTGTTLQAELDGIQADTEDIQSRLPATLVSGRIDASVGGVAVSCTEPTGVPTASPNLLTALSWIFTLSRNKITQTSSTQTVFADDGSTAVSTSTVSDDGTTFTRGEFS